MILYSRAYSSLGWFSLVGGYTATESLSSVIGFDGEDWDDETVPDLPIKVHQHCTVSYNLFEYMVIGGIVDGKHSKRTFRWSPFYMDWFEGPELNVARSGATCGILESDEIVIAGGYNDGGLLDSSEVRISFSADQKLVVEM